MNEKKDICTVMTNLEDPLHDARYEMIEENCQPNDNHNIPAQVKVKLSSLHDVCMTSEFL